MFFFTLSVFANFLTAVFFNRGHSGMTSKLCIRRQLVGGMNSLLTLVFLMGFPVEIYTSDDPQGSWSQRALHMLYCKKQQQKYTDGDGEKLPFVSPAFVFVCV